MNDERKELVNKLETIANEVRESNQPISCILFSLCGAMILGLERDMVEPVIAVTMKHLEFAQGEMVLEAETTE